MLRINVTVEEGTIVSPKEALTAMKARREEKKIAKEQSELESRQLELDLKGLFFVENDRFPTRKEMRTLMRDHQNSLESVED